MNISGALKKAEVTLSGGGISSARLDAEVLLAFALGLAMHRLHLDGARRLTDAEARVYDGLVSRRCAAEPVAYIVGRKQFWSLDLEVNPDVLIPRPETEVVVEEALRLVDCMGSRIAVADVGTGSGAIGIAMAVEFPAAVITAIDISPEALAVARRNARAHGVDGRIFFVCGNLCGSLSEKFDIVVSNPPYIAEEEYAALSGDIRCYEPRRALVAGPRGTEIHRELIRESGGALKKGGWLVMEMGVGQERDLSQFLMGAGWCDVRCRNDYAGIPRVIAARRKE